MRVSIVRFGLKTRLDQMRTDLCLAHDEHIQTLKQKLLSGVVVLRIDNRAHLVMPRPDTYHSPMTGIT